MAVEMRDFAPNRAAESSGGAASPILSLQIRKRFDTAFEIGKDSFELDIAAELSPGITIIFGPSGAGKTTLLECIAGLLRADRGRIAIGDRVFFDHALKVEVHVHQRRIGYVFQDLALFPHLSVQKNIEYGIRDLNPASRQKKSKAILDSFRIFSLRDRKPNQISGGERQRAALARSLVTDPCLLLLDEPLAALDGPTKSTIVEDLRMWNAAHRIPILYVTHSREEVLALGDRVLMLEAGKIVAHGPPREVVTST
jgi:molybdate transport system ATP-binding protein